MFQHHGELHKETVWRPFSFRSLIVPDSFSHLISSCLSPSWPRCEQRRLLPTTKSLSLPSFSHHSFLWWRPLGSFHLCHYVHRGCWALHRHTRVTYIISGSQNAEREWQTPFTWLLFYDRKVTQCCFNFTIYGCVVYCVWFGNIILCHLTGFACFRTMERDCVSIQFICHIKYILNK